MDAINLPPSFLVGVSMGSCISIHLAVFHPKHVLGLFLISPLSAWEVSTSLRTFSGERSRLLKLCSLALVLDVSLRKVSSLASALLFSLPLTPRRLTRPLLLVVGAGRQEIWEVWKEAKESDDPDLLGQAAMGGKSRRPFRFAIAFIN